jgi:uncharacterized protein YktA (UPF0223 family)
MKSTSRYQSLQDSNRKLKTENERLHLQVVTFLNDVRQLVNAPIDDSIEYLIRMREEFKKVVESKDNK